MTKLNRPYALVLFLLAAFACSDNLLILASSPATHEETGDSTLSNLRRVDGPGVVLHKTPGPLGPGPVGDGFPGSLPAEFIRVAYGIDVLQTEGGRRLMGDEKGSCQATDGDRDLGAEEQFGAALLSRARKMFVDRGCEAELDAFLETGVSNPDAGNRRMHWATIEIMPHKSLALHSHPNIEFAYVVEGAMHEWRLIDETVEKKRAYVPEAVDVGGGEKSLRYHGPNLTSVVADREGTFEHRILREGDMFINVIGDVHQSFAEEEGAKLFVLWGDGNADIPDDVHPQHAEIIFNKQSAKAWA